MSGSFFSPGKREPPPIALALAIVAAASPLFLTLALPALDNWYWCEEGAWLRRAGAFLITPGELLSFYGRDFNPLFLLSVVVEVLLFGADTRAMHAIDITIHLGNTILLATLFVRFTGKGILSGILATLWMISRHTDEAVFWMGARPIALSLLLAFSAWHLFESERPLRRRAGLVLFLASILTKETGALLAPLFTLRLAMLPGVTEGGKGISSLKRSRPLWILLVSYLALRVAAGVLLGKSEAYGAVNPIAPVLKLLYLLHGFLELHLLSWNSALSGTAVLLFFTAAWRFGGQAGRFGALWMLVGLLPFLPIPQHAPRYSLWPYPGFLLAVGGIWISAEAWRRRGARIGGVFLAAALLFFQGYVVYLDQLDHHMRSEYIRKLEADYLAVEPPLPEGIVFASAHPGKSVQPEINRRCLVPKLNAPIPGGFLGIIPVEDLIGPAEMKRGRVWLLEPSPGTSSGGIIHDGERFLILEGRAGDSLPETVKLGRIVSLRLPK